MASYVTNRARPSKASEKLKQPRSRSQSPTLADRAVYRVADQRDAVQKKTFTKWVNHHLQKANISVTEMYEDFRDGHKLLLLLELLTDHKLPREKGHLRFHKLQNCQTALNFLNSIQVKVVNIHPDDIVDGNPKITLGLIWIIILHFQISDIKVTGQVEEMSPKSKLLHWCRRITEGYPQVAILNFTTSWKDGLAFNAIIHRYRPDLIHLSELNRDTPEYNVENAFNVAEKELGVPRLLDVEDVVTDHADEKSIMTYVSSLYEKFPRAVSSFESSEDEEKVLKYEEYCKCSEELVAWIKRVMIQLESRTFPTTIQGMKDVIHDFDQFYSEEFSRIEENRNYVKAIMKDVQLFYGPMSSWLEFPQGCHPRDIEVLWLKLLRCIEERNKTLRVEMTRVRKVYQLADEIIHEAEEMETLLPELEERVGKEERIWDTLDVDVAHERFKNLEVSLKIFEKKLYRIYQDFDHLITGHYQGLEDIRTRIHKIQTRWKVLLSRLSRFNIQTSRQFMPFDTTATVTSPERKTKADWEADSGVSSEKRQRTTFSSKTLPMQFTSIQKVSKKALEQQKLPTYDAPITKSVIRSTESTPDGQELLKTVDIRGSQLSTKGNQGARSQDPAQRRKTIEAILITVKERQVIVQAAPYGNDLPSVEHYYKEHQKEHEDIMSFREEVEQACKQTSQDDQVVKEKTTELKRIYSELVRLSVHRTRCLRSLLTFMSEATKELVWMNQKEELETVRDWSDEGLDVDEIEKYRKEFKTEMEMHEIEQRSVIGKGEHLIQSGHPAPHAIEAYVTSLRLQWTWIVEVYQALEEHLLNAHAYHQFFNEAKESRLWMSSKSDELRTKFVERDSWSKEELILSWKKLMPLRAVINNINRKEPVKVFFKLTTTT